MEDGTWGPFDAFLRTHGSPIQYAVVSLSRKKGEVHEKCEESCGAYEMVIVDGT